MSELKYKHWELPVKVPGGFLVRITFSKIEDAIGFLANLGFLGHNSAEETVDMWKRRAVMDIEKEAKSLKAKIRKFFGRA